MNAHGLPCNEDRKTNDFWNGKFPLINYHCYFSVSVPIACPPGWVFYGTSCYLFSVVRKKWIDAKTDCRTSGGYLLKIDNAVEQHFISVKQGSSWRVSSVRVSSHLLMP